ncbi:MAG: hypothetical protein R2911_38650 [Caldilineaceae bacterium]
MRTAGIDLFTIVRMISEELGCNTVCGASSISFGLPNRAVINSAFVPMAMAAGMTCAITNPLEKEIRHAVYAADVLMGNDQDCMRYLTAMREAEADASGGAAAGDDRRAARAARRASRRERPTRGE